MKDAMKFIGLFVVGLIMVVFIYPIIHELSHSIVATILGVKIVEITIFSSPSVLCNIEGVNSTCVTIIGLSGIILPFLFSIIIRPRNFWMWYANFIVQGISTLSFLISIISILLFVVDMPMINDDITQILLINPSTVLWLFILSFILFIIAVTIIVKAKPFRRCEVYFLQNSRVKI